MNHPGLFVPDSVNALIDADGRMFYWRARDPADAGALRADPDRFCWASEQSLLGLNRAQMEEYWSDDEIRARCCVGIPVFVRADAGREPATVG